MSVLDYRFWFPRIDVVRATLARLIPFALVSILAAVVLGGCAVTGDRPQTLQQDGVFVYPAQAKAAHQEGHVIVRFDITRDGQVQNARVESAEPDGVFDAAALSYVQGRVYVPAQRSGEAAPVTGVSTRIEFKLGDADHYGNTAPPQ